MLNNYISNILRKITGVNRMLPMIHLASKYEFEVDKPSHIKFSVVELGEPRLKAIDALRKVSLNGEVKEKTTKLVLTSYKATVLEGLIEYSNKSELLRVLKYNSFYNVILTPYLEIGVINGKKVLVDVKTPDRIRPKTKKEAK